MSKFTYNGDEYDIDLHGDPCLESAFMVAADAHKAHAPRKNSGKPYIEHVITVYKILDGFGCNTTQKAIGLLHDTVEDYYSRLSDSPVEALRQDLAARLGKCSVDPKWVSEVCDGVGYLTNGAIRYNDNRTWHMDIPENFKQGNTKRLYQTTRARQITDALRDIKIADQAASVLEDIQYCPLPEAGDKDENQKAASNFRQKALTFALKGYDVADAASGSNRNNPFFRLYAQLYLILHEMYYDAVAGQYEAMRDIRKEAQRPGFLEDTIAHARSAGHFSLFNDIQLPEQVTHWRPPDQPIERITISKKTGMVVGYRFRDETQNRAPMDALLNEIEKVRDARVTTRSYAVRSQGEQTEMIDFHIKNIKGRAAQSGVPFDIFMEKAMETGAMGTGFHQHIREIQRNIDSQKFGRISK